MDGKPSVIMNIIEQPSGLLTSGKSRCCRAYIPAAIQAAHFLLLSLFCFLSSSSALCPPPPPPPLCLSLLSSLYLCDAHPHASNPAPPADRSIPLNTQVGLVDLTTFSARLITTWPTTAAREEQTSKQKPNMTRREKYKKRKR